MNTSTHVHEVESEVLYTAGGSAPGAPLPIVFNVTACFRQVHGSFYHAHSYTKNMYIVLLFLIPFFFQNASCFTLSTHAHKVGIIDHLRLGNCMSGANEKPNNYRSVQKTHTPRWYRNCHNTLYAYSLLPSQAC